MANEEIAKLVEDSLRGGKLVGVYWNQDSVPSFTMLFENGEEQKASLTIKSAITSLINPGVAEIKARIEVSIQGWKK